MKQPAQNQPSSYLEDSEAAAFKKALQEGRLREIEAILARPPALNHDFGGGVTPLHISIQESQVAAVQTLLARGADLQATTGAGWTPFHVVALTGNLEIAELLVAQDRQVPDQPNVQGQTPLDIAKAHKRTEVVALFKKTAKKTWQFWK